MSASTIDAPHDGAKLRAARTRLGITRAELARRSKTSVASLGFIEAGAVPKHSQVLERAWKAIRAAEVEKQP